MTQNAEGEKKKIVTAEYCERGRECEKVIIFS